MEAFTLTGNDTYLAEQFIQQHKQILVQNWAIFNFQEFSADRLEEALQYAQTSPLGGQQKILVIRGSGGDNRLKRLVELGFHPLESSKNISLLTGLLRMNF